MVMLVNVLPIISIYIYLRNIRARSLYMDVYLRYMSIVP